MKKYRITYNNGGKLDTDTLDSLHTASMRMQKLFADGCTNLQIEEYEDDITNIVKTYEDACKVLRVEPISRKTNMVMFTSDRDTSEVFTLSILQSANFLALLKLETITAALNEGWKPDWEDKRQTKWSVWYDAEMKKFWFDECSMQSTSSSRLYFKTRDLAEYAAKQFGDLYRQLLIEQF